jgi:hypothetical protein
LPPGGLLGPSVESGLSRMKGNFHVRFLEGGGLPIARSYSTPPGSCFASVDTQPCPAFLHSAYFILPSPRGGLGWLCPAFQGSQFEVRGSRFGANHKHPESNSPLPPPSGWSGGTLDKPWTYPGTIEPLEDPVFDQARLSKSVPGRSSAGKRCASLDVGGWMFDVGCSAFPAGRSRFSFGRRRPALLRDA